MICCGLLPVMVRIALLFSFLKEPQKLGGIFYFLSLFCFLSISNILSVSASPFSSRSASGQPPLAGPNPLFPWKASDLMGKAEPGPWVPCLDDPGRWSALHLCRALE